MEDDKLKDLFKEFNPELSPDSLFMSRLQHSIDAIETIRQQNIALQRKYRKAVTIAAITGFIAGFLFSFTFPYITSIAIGLLNGLPNQWIVTLLMSNINVFSWSIIGIITLIIAINTYETSLAILSRSTEHK